ncbi:MAG: hypothetical protein ABSE16_13315 [Verrucomicrobiota bacterium]
MTSSCAARIFKVTNCDLEQSFEGQFDIAICDVKKTMRSQIVTGSEGQRYEQRNASVGGPDWLANPNNSRTKNRFGFRFGPHLWRADEAAE